MTAPLLPENLDAERALIGGLMMGHGQVDLVLAALTASDFADQRHQRVFIAAGNLRAKGDKMDPVALRDELDRSGERPVEASYLIELQAAGTTNTARNVEIVTRHAVERRVILTANDVAQVAREGTMSPAELVSLAQERFGSIEAPVGDDGELAGLSTVDDFLETADLKPAPWVVPGLLRQGWRCLVVAPEGVGKSVASRQVAIAAAQGVHPFTHHKTEPVRTLIVDLENPDDAIADTCKPITAKAREVVGATYDPGRAWLWRRPDGINLRDRADRVAFERVVADTRPDLVCLGPLYKAYRATARENDELAAGEVQAVLDRLRTRYGFALLMEHHAPKASGLSPRDLVPYGSSLWLRWPELGLKLTPCDGDEAPATSLNVGRFRRDRLKTAWPARLDRGGSGRWPWVGYWPEGMGDL